ncbi:low affinity immunoglobulin gamma Fc region receptor II-like isoform X2 [Cyprinus carpio]|uniref:low affinity immunoglobulin gamma Fc region receptor II-like isoform X2 n=1 Tax=Cyprinus carpio TaxID=7962 RepID=UPI001C593414|nr:low affinity immunoglobulin gamma Fc region receptor II-like isoform X2 [Cyprinus carpio]
MDPSLLTLMLLLISNIHPGQSEDKPKLTVKPQSSVFTGDTVTLSCDVGQSTGRTIIWYKGFQTTGTGDQTKTLRDVRVSDGGEYACAVRGETTQGQRVMLTVRERPKPAVRVQPDGRVFREQMVTLTCDIQETDVSSWSYSWNKDDSVIHVSQSQEYRISSVNESHTGQYSCTGRETGGSRYSHTSDKVTLILSGSLVPTFSDALIIGVSSGLSGAFLLIFLLVLLFCCKRNKGGGSPSPSTDHQLPNISQTSEHQRKNGQTPACSNAVIEPSCVTYVNVDLKSMEEMREKKKVNKGKESFDTVYSKLKI